MCVRTADGWVNFRARKGDGDDFVVGIVIALAAKVKAPHHNAGQSVKCLIKIKLEHVRKLPVAQDLQPRPVSRHRTSYFNADHNHACLLHRN